VIGVFEEIVMTGGEILFIFLQGFFFFSFFFFFLVGERWEVGRYGKGRCLFVIDIFVFKIWL
jgi:hypothetical protein